MVRPWKLWMGLGVGGLCLVVLALAVLFRPRTQEQGPKVEPVQVTLNSPSLVTVTVGNEVRFDVGVQRSGYSGPVRLELSNLPAGVTAEPVEVGGERRNAEVVLRVDASAKIEEKKDLAIRALIVESLVAETKLQLNLRAAPQAKEIVNSIGMKVVLIPAGKFLMGSPPTEMERQNDEGPQHEVEISRAFYMGMYEVTVGEYRAFVKGASYQTVAEKDGGAFRWKGKDWEKDPQLNWKNPGFVQEDDYPVTCIAWSDADAFCDWLNKQADKNRREGWAYRLPTEAEWEYACRGDSPAYQVFNSGNHLSSNRANFHGQFPYGNAMKGPVLGHSCKVGNYPPNGFGLYDMHGNVCEWCQDWYGSRDSAIRPVRDPKGPATGSHRVCRGGGWDFRGQHCRSAWRNTQIPTFRFPSLGFRVVLAPAGTITPPAGESGGTFQLSLKTKDIAVQTGASAKLPIRLRRNGILDPVRLDVSDLPTGVSVDAVEVPPDRTEAELVLRARSDAPANPGETIVVRALVAGKILTKETVQLKVLALTDTAKMIVGVWQVVNSKTTSTSTYEYRNDGIWISRSGNQVLSQAPYKVQGATIYRAVRFAGGGVTLRYTIKELTRDKLVIAPPRGALIEYKRVSGP